MHGTHALSMRLLSYARKILRERACGGRFGSDHMGVEANGRRSRGAAEK
jgi:hypothetical protein